MNKVLWLDTETTGLDAIKQDVIQIAYLVEIDGEVVEEQEFKCQPFNWAGIQDRALEVHGYTRDNLKTFEAASIIKCRMDASLERYIEKFNKDDKFTLAGYNVQFDYRFMKEWYAKCGDKYWGSFVNYKMYDGYPLFQAYANAANLDLPNHKLTTAAAHFGFKFGAHDALEDIRVTRQVVKALERIFLDGIEFGRLPPKQREAVELVMAQS